MNPPNNPTTPPRAGKLRQPTSRHVLERLAADGVLDEATLDEAFAILEPGRWARIWASRALLFFGVALGLAGIIFFFAFNWDALPDLAKLGLIEVGFVACMAGATMRGLKSVTSKMLTVAAAVLIGVFLAVFGQIYQTGADPWQLFALWSALMLPLLTLARTQAGWAIFGTIVSTALVLFLEQYLYLDDYRRLSTHLYPGSVALVFGSLWFGLEVLRNQDARDWLDPPWVRKACALIVFGALAGPEIIHDGGWTWHTAQLSALGITSLLAWAQHSRRAYDLEIIAIGGLAWLLVVVGRFTIWLFDVLSGAGVVLMIAGAFTLGASGMLVWGLRKFSERSKEYQSEENS
jgi:uncharacterized membrane protein